MHFLKRAAGRASQRHHGLASLEGKGAGAVYASWLTQLSCCLQKGNVACLRGASGLGFGREAEEGQEGAVDWVEENMEDLLALV